MRAIVQSLPWAIRNSRHDNETVSSFPRTAELTVARIFGWFLWPMLAFFGLATGTIGAVGLSSTWSLVRTAESAEGTVVEIVSRERADGSVFYPVVEFIAGGIPHRIESNLGTAWERYKKGDSVRVLYDPLAPDKARIDSFWDLWAVPVIAGGVAFVHLFAAAFVFHRRRARRRLRDGRSEERRS